MQALLLEQPERLVIAPQPEPTCAEHEVIIQVGAVGVCGTDFHIYRGYANYNCDVNGKPIPLEIQPQILGHEFCGTVVEVGRAVRDLQRDDRVAVDQGLNCFSRRIDPACEYCRSGNSHQCLNYQERGITGLPGAMQEFVSMPAVNVLPVADALPFAELALAEPLGCVIHSIDTVEKSQGRYVFPGAGTNGAPIENILILGCGPAGLLFLQYIRQVKGFEGRVLVADAVEEKLRLAEKFGATVINIRQTDLVQAVRELTKGVKIHLLIEACGHGSAFENMPALLRKQATVVLYGHGHEGTDLSVLNRLLFIEPNLVVSVGASGKLDDETHKPETCCRAVQLIQNGTIDVRSIISHRYPALDQIGRAFREDCKRSDYVKGVLAFLQ